MPSDIETLARGVLLPVSNNMRVEDHLLAFLDQGGRAILFGEEGDEFQTGRLRPTRLAEETPEFVGRTLEALRARAGGLLVACDADLAAVNRLQGLAGELPTLVTAQNLPDDQLYTIVHDHARCARALGFTLFLSPTADLIVENAWLEGRTLGPEPVARRLVDLNVRAIEAAGVTSALKHFPGHPRLTGNPSQGVATVLSGREEILSHLGAFRQGIASGAGGVVLSSAVFPAFGGPANLSPDVTHLLRRDLGFKGLVVTLDLDHPACLGDATLAEVCRRALVAGADLLLLSPQGARQIPQIAHHLARAVDDGTLPLDRLTAAADQTRRLAL